MTSVFSLRHALFIVVTLGVYAITAALDAPRWLAMLAAGLAFAAVLSGSRLLRRRRRGKNATPLPDPRIFGRTLADRVRRFAGRGETGERGVYCVFAGPGVDASALLRAAEFTPEALDLPGGPAWRSWRRRGALCLEIPSVYADEAMDADWQTILDLLPRGLLARTTHGALVLVDWSRGDTDEVAAIDAWAELARGRLQEWAARIGLALPVTIAVTSGGAPALARLLAPPLKLDRAGPWGAPLPHIGDPVAAAAAAAAELEGLAAELAGRVTWALGDEERERQELTPGSSSAHELLPLITGVRRLVTPASRVAAAFTHRDLWVRGIYLTSHAPAAFLSGLIAALLRGGELVRTSAHAERRRRRSLSAAGLLISAAAAVLAVLGLHAYRDNGAYLDAVQAAINDLKATSIRDALRPLRRLRAAHKAVASVDPWPGPLAGLTSATRLQVPLRGLLGDSVHHALVMPTVDRALADLCPVQAPALDDAGAADLSALLDLYVLTTWVDYPGKPNARSAAEDEVYADRPRRDEILLQGVTTAWADDPNLAPIAKEIADEMIAQAKSPRRPELRREQACVREALGRLQGWRERACSSAGLAVLASGQHSLRELLQSPHAAALARPDEAQIDERFTAAGFAKLTRAFDDPRPRCGPGGFAAGYRRGDDERAAETRRRALFDAYAGDYVAAWERFLGALEVATSRHECDDLPTLVRKMAAPEGPLGKLPELITRHAIPPATPAEPWQAAPAATIRGALGSYAAVATPPADDQPTAMNTLLEGVAKLGVLLGAGASQSPHEADAALRDAKDLAENACSLVEDRAASLLRRVVAPLYDRAVRCVERGGRPGLDPWCAEVAGPYHRGLGHAYPFDADARRDVPLTDLCAFYCPHTGSAWAYYQEHLSSVLFAAGNGAFVGNKDPGFASFRPYNQALASFYARTFRLTNLLFPMGDAAQPALQLAAYIPPIDQPGVEVEEITLAIDGQEIHFTNARERWLDLAWPGEQGARTRAGASLTIRGRYEDEPFREELHERGAWGLFRLLERAAEASWAGDHLLFRFAFAALHGLTVDLELDAGPANELLVDRDGAVMSVFRRPGVAPPLQLRRTGTRCPL